MRDGALDAGVRVINEVAEEVLAERSEVTAIDIWDLFGGDGAYQGRLAGPDGTRSPLESVTVCTCRDRRRRGWPILSSPNSTSASVPAVMLALS